jgi:hypothetical protein
MGDKETKEAVVGLMKCAALLGGVFKDGVQVADFPLIFAKIEGDAALKKALTDMYVDIEKVPSEVKEMKLPEYIDILMAVAQEVPKLIDAVKK